MKRVYLAAPLFTLAERQFNRKLKAALENVLENVEVILPQDYKFDGKYNDPKWFQEVYDACMRDLSAADLVIAILDGADADSGTSFEVGYAIGRTIPVIDVRTDFREQQERGLNLMLSRGVTECVIQMSFKEDVDALARVISRKASRLLKLDADEPLNDRPKQNT